MRSIAVCAPGIALIAIMMWFSPPDADDFAPFYRAATLVTQHQSPYAEPFWSPRTQTDGRFLPFLRIPSYAGVLAPFTALPYRWARRMWLGMLVLACAGCIALAPVGRRPFAAAMAFSFPLANTLMVGQDTTLLVLILFAAAYGLSTRREFAAGAIASLLAIKITCLPAVALVLFLKSRRAATGMMAGLAAQVALSFAVGGPGWPADYLAILRNPLVDPDLNRLVSVRAIAGAFSLPAAVWVAASVALYLVVWRIGRKIDAADALTMALALGLIAAPHSRVYDGVLVLPLLVRVASLSSWRGIVAIAALTPLPWLMVLMGRPWMIPAGCCFILFAVVTAAITLGKSAATEAVGTSAAAA